MVYELLLLDPRLLSMEDTTAMEGALNGPLFRSVEWFP
jgi:hypothetical protein